MAEAKYVTDDHGVALYGYDAVSYFEDGAPAAGSAANAVQWSGATWHFTSAEHAKTFEASPEKFAPMAGGQCSFGSSLGQTADASPESYRIIDGKLYLMMSGPVASLSKLFTGRIKKKVGPSAN